MTSATRTKRLSGLAAYAVSPARLKSLYSDFPRQKASNPASFTANIEWWKRALAQYVAAGLQDGTRDVLILHAGPELAEALRHEGTGRPLGLAAVVTELHAARSLLRVDEFLASATPVYRAGALAGRVAAYVVGRPLWWALEQLSLVEPAGHVAPEATLWRTARGRYVVRALLERAADAVVQRQRQKGAVSPADALYSCESFAEAFRTVDTADGALSLSDDDVRVLVKFLDRDKGVIVSDKDVIKFIDPSVEAPAKSITAIDRGIVELKCGVENMEAQVEDLNKRISEKTQKATEHLRANRKEVALTQLKMRKQLEDLLRKRLGSLEVLQSTLMQVEGAAQDVEIMNQYASSTATLRALLAHPALQRAHVEETMAAMADARAAARALDDAVRLGGELAAPDGAGGEMDERALEAELAALAQDVRREEREDAERQAREDAEVRGATMPSVPQAEPEREREVRTPAPRADVQSTTNALPYEEQGGASRELAT